MGSTRKTIRKAIAAIFVTEGSFTGGVLAYAPVDLQGMSPVLSIYTSKTHHIQESYASQHNFYTYNLEVLIKRVGGETAEDAFDDLHEAIRATIKTNQSNANWDYLSLEDPSDAYFAEISGVAYRVETHPLYVKETT